jgi:hypothetical protein
VAISIGYSSIREALKYFPDLCAALTLRSKEQVAKRGAVVRTTLEDALQKFPPPTLDQLAKVLNMPNACGLRIREPVLCSQLVARRKEWQIKNQECVKDILERALERDNIPAFDKFCKAERLSIELIRARFPEQKKAYEERFRSLRAVKRQQQIENFQHEVARIVRLLRERSEYPSAARVLAENPSLGSRGWYELQVAIRMGQTP